ncbi:MAG: DegT/DnrJ/EryC1/StrS family aminotransferase [Patescibacteria group bacterium]|jgi:dTDP-4-amino-4,6-dideoxygalactose transaminase|nr:DegT/DnrJ/EryC1/StrS family aminotransferase [Patescibacteria group bacterium]|tara:strand:- start:11993 stop:13207 length:1215 start_codon:yes stop_codon:yes gene_type:complete
MANNKQINKDLLGVGHFIASPTAKRYVGKVLESGRLSYGPFIKSFEERFSSSHGCMFGLMVNSGTSALRIAVACLKEVHAWKEGNEVLVPAITFVATANIVVDQGLKPVFVDVDSKTYNIDPEKIEACITKKTRAIIVAHLFGQPADMRPIMKLARKHKLKVVEDSCETMFTEYRNKSVGSFGDIGCFSTYVAHLIVTGVGGVAITNNKRYARIMRSLANHGRNNIYISIDDDKGVDKDSFRKVIANRFNFIRPGYSFRVTEMEGALGCAQLDEVESTFPKRVKNAQYLIDKLQVIKDFIQLPYYPSHIGHAFMIFPVVLQKKYGNKRALVNYLEERGIETRDMMPLINQPYYRKTYNIKKGQFPVADWINLSGFYIGCHHYMRNHELDYIIDTFINYFSKKQV